MADEKKYDIGIDPKQVSSVNISRYADGYNYASVSIKAADNEYMSIHYEWKGNTVPEFALNAMEIMKVLGMEKAGIVEGNEEAHDHFEDRAKKGLPPWMKKDDEEEEDPKKKKKTDKKDKKKDDKKKKDKKK